MTDALITTDELAALLEDSPGDRPVVLDVRYGGPGGGSGETAYLDGHLPGARFVDLEQVLSDPADGGAGGRHPLPSRERFQAGMRGVGVSNDRPVIVYDDWSSIAASRAWWLLRHFGHEDVRVLDGGLGAWRTAGLPVEPGHVEVPEGDFTAADPRLTVLDADAAAELATSGVLLDGRPAARFRGESETIDPVAGHIPGARSLPAVELVDRSGAFLPDGELRARFGEVGLTPGTTAGAYCGSGVQACHVALAAAVAGIDDDLGLYPGSWSGWVASGDRPVATGD